MRIFIIFIVRHLDICMELFIHLLFCFEFWNPFAYLLTSMGIENHVNKAASHLSSTSSPYHSCLPSTSPHARSFLNHVHLLGRPLQARHRSQGLRRHQQLQHHHRHLSGGLARVRGGREEGLNATQWIARERERWVRGGAVEWVTSMARPWWFRLGDPNLLR